MHRKGLRRSIHDKEYDILTPFNYKQEIELEVLNAACNVKAVSGFIA